MFKLKIGFQLKNDPRQYLQLLNIKLRLFWKW